MTFFRDVLLYFWLASDFIYNNLLGLKFCNTSISLLDLQNSLLFHTICKWFSSNCNKQIYSRNVLFFQGHDTTASTIGFAIYLLATNLDIQVCKLIHSSVLCKLMKGQ